MALCATPGIFRAPAAMSGACSQPMSPRDIAFRGPSAGPEMISTDQRPGILGLESAVVSSFRWLNFRIMSWSMNVGSRAWVKAKSACSRCAPLSRQERQDAVPAPAALVQAATEVGNGPLIVAPQGRSRPLPPPCAAAARSPAMEGLGS